jgi:tripartite-type tricarboxylate transporter receptor subunit TctC
MNMLSVIFCLAALLPAFTVQAQSSLSRTTPIEIVVPFGPGGAATSSAQFVASVLKHHGYQALVVNKPGNNGIIAGNQVAKSPPDGHTLFLGSTSTVSANIAFRNEQTGMEFDDKSFVPVILTNRAALGLIVSQKSSIKTFDQFKLFVKNNPDKFNIGTYNATLGRVIKYWAKLEGLPEPTIVVYKGSAPMIIDTASGVLFCAFDNIGWGTPAMPLLEDTKLNLIAAFDNSASKQVNKINPTATDLSRETSKLKFSVWNGLFAPAGTPANIINQINTLINKSMNEENFREKTVTMEGLGGSVADMQSLITADQELFRKIEKSK